MASQNLVRGQPTTLTPGDPLVRGLGHYGKGGPPPGSAAALIMAPPSSTAQPPGLTGIRGGEGGIRKHTREGGLMPGRSYPKPGNI